MNGTGNSSGDEEVNANDGSPLRYLRSFVERVKGSANVSKDRDGEGEDAPQMVGDRLKQKRLKSKCRSSAVKKKEFSTAIVPHHKHRKKIGQHRSVVRYIGSNVPLASHNRAYFEIFDEQKRMFMNRAVSAFTVLRTNIDYARDNLVPTLADIGQLVWEENAEDDDEYDDWQSETMSQVSDLHYAESLASEARDDDVTKWVNNQTSSAQNEAVDEPVEPREPAPAATKISALEDELARLRAQIAMIVSNQHAPVNNGSGPGPAARAPVAVVNPSLAAAPTISAIPAPPPPPPPPPPPLQPPTTASFSTASRGSRLLRDAATSGEQGVETRSSVSDNMAPSLNDIVKGINSVRLRSSGVERSPGGTPMKKNTRHAGPSESTNAADIIANALREKFANYRMTYESPERVSPYASPQSGFTPSPPGQQSHKKKRSPMSAGAIVTSGSLRAASTKAPRPKVRSKPVKRTSTGGARKMKPLSAVPE